MQSQYNPSNRCALRDVAYDGLRYCDTDKSVCVRITTIARMRIALCTNLCCTRRGIRTWTKVSVRSHLNTTRVCTFMSLVQVAVVIT